MEFTRVAVTARKSPAAVEAENLTDTFPAVSGNWQERAAGAKAKVLRLQRSKRHRAGFRVAPAQARAHKQPPHWRTKVRVTIKVYWLQAVFLTSSYWTTMLSLTVYNSILHLYTNCLCRVSLLHFFSPVSFLTRSLNCVYFNYEKPFKNIKILQRNCFRREPNCSGT